MWVSTLVLPKLSRVSLVGDARAALLYVANWHFLGQATDYFADDVQRFPFLHFWSLAVEEQFYFVFPLLLLGLLAFARRRRRAWLVPAGLATLLVASLVAQWWVADTDPLRAYYGTDTRLYQLLAGALLATLRHRLPSAARGAGASAVAALAVLVMLATDAVGMSVATRGVVAAVVTLIGVAGVEMAPTSIAARALSVRPMTYLGRISYGTYLWHWPIIVLVGAGWVLTPLEMAGVAAVGATAVSAVSFRLLETPIRRAPRLDRVPRGVVAVGLAPTVTPKFDQGACTVETIDGCFLHRGSGLHLHLTGDSNAQMLVPVFQALAEQYDFTLTATVRLGCPWQLGLEWEPQDEVLVRNCNASRVEWYDDVLPLLQPDVLVTVHVPRDRGTRSDSFFRAGPGLDGTIAEVVAATTATTLDRFHELGVRTVLFEPLPYGPKVPTICVSGASTVGDCAYEVEPGPFPTEATYRREADDRDDVWAVDADRLACPFLPVCLPMIHRELVFENQFHLSNRWLVDHSDAWWALLVDSGALEGWFDPS